jgi:hypothetical protein
MSAAALLAGCALLAISLSPSLASADPVKKPVASTSTSAAKHPKTTTAQSKTALTHSATHAVPTKASATAQARKVVVTRKKVNGRWIRVTQGVHSRSSGPSYQTHPDADRYQQIQQALADNGYFKGTVDGKWGDDSVAALKQFQTDRKIPNDGKISSLSLIGLGLGPNRETASAPPAPATPPAQPAPDAH